MSFDYLEHQEATMTDDLLDEIRAFLADLGADLTNLHVKAMQYLNAPHDQAATEALASIPAGLLGRAQVLGARIDEQREDDGGEDAPKAKSAARPRAKSKR